MPNVVTLSSDRWNVLMAYQWKGELKNVFISEQNPFFRPWIYREYQFALQVRNENGMQPRPQTPCQRTTGPYELHPKSLTGCWCKDLTDEQMDEFNTKRGEAMSAFSEAEWQKAIDLFTEAIKVNSR